MKRERDLETRCDTIAQAIGTARCLAKAAPVSPLLDEGDCCRDANKIKTQMLLAKRRALVNTDRTGRAQISKAVRKKSKLRG